MGTAMTDDQVSELARLAPTVLLALDADSAGQEAMLRAARVAAGRKLALRVVPLPPGSDPADLAQEQGHEALAQLVGQSVPFVRFRVERELAKGDLSDAEGKDAVIAALGPVFATIPPSAMREELVALVADRTDLAPTLVASWLAREAAAAPPPAAAAPAPAAQVTPRATSPRTDGATRAEISFLAQCMATPTTGREVLDAIDIQEMFASDVTRRAAELVRSRLGGHAVEPSADDEELSALWARLGVVTGQRAASEDVLNSDRIELALHAVRRDGSLSPGQRAARVRELRKEKDSYDARFWEDTRPAPR
jgi:DNA primase